MRFSTVISASTALVAAATIASAQTVSIPKISEKCKTHILSMVGDEKLNQCLPVASLIPLINKNTPSSPESLKTVFKQFCSTPACDQSMIDSYGKTIAEQCAEDLNVVDNPAHVVASIFKMYTPLQASACYLDSDNDFCMTKSILGLKLDLNVGVNDVSVMFNGAGQADVCTKCNQHIVGTFMDYISKNPTTTFPITTEQKDKVVSVITDKCGAEFGAGLTAATGAPFPEIQKLASSSKKSAGNSVKDTSFAPLAVFLTASALAARAL